MKSKNSMMRSIKAFVRIHHEIIRSFLAWSAVAILLIILLYIFGWELYKSGSSAFNGIPAKPYNELIKAAVDIRLNQAGDMFQISVGVLVALWGLLFVRKEEVVLVLNDFPELVMYMCATILLLLSIVCYKIYVDFVMDSYKSASRYITLEARAKVIQDDKFADTIRILSKERDRTVLQQKMQNMTIQKLIDINKKDDIDIPDIFDPAINYVFNAQWAFLIAGIMNALITFISAHKIRPTVKRRN